MMFLSIAAPLTFFGGVADRFGGLLANPEALIQGHAVWHAMGAIALWAAYEAYVSTGFDCSTLSQLDAQTDVVKTRIPHSCEV
ncbi:MAG: hypothetical protein ABIZ04_16705 [Opitutus sp.]